MSAETLEVYSIESEFPAYGDRYENVQRPGITTPRFQSMGPKGDEADLVIVKYFATEALARAYIARMQRAMGYYVKFKSTTRLIQPTGMITGPARPLLFQAVGGTLDNANYMVKLAVPFSPTAEVSAG